MFWIAGGQPKRGVCVCVRRSLEYNSWFYLIGSLMTSLVVRFTFLCTFCIEKNKKRRFCSKSSFIYVSKWKSTKPLNIFLLKSIKKTIHSKTFWFIYLNIYLYTKVFSPNLIIRQIVHFPENYETNNSR